MSITDELREWMKGSTLSSWTAEHLLAIADRIDAEHDSACAEAYGNGVMSVPIALDESAWVDLPKDADGEVWHVGDLAVGEVNPNNPKAVERMLWYGPDSGWQLETDTIIFPCPERVRHHQTPTIEDVLTEFGIDWEHESDCEDRAALLKEYAAKLREMLAGDAE